MKLTAAQLRQLKRDNAAQTVRLSLIPKEQWPVVPFTETSVRLCVWRSKRFLAQLFSDKDGGMRLSINRTEWDERQGQWRENISWDELQALKAEAGFSGCWAVEIFPADHAVVNVANMRHLWLLAEAPDYAWNAAIHPKAEAA